MFHTLTHAHGVTYGFVQHDQCMNEYETKNAIDHRNRFKPILQNVYIIQCQCKKKKLLWLRRYFISYNCFSIGLKRTRRSVKVDAYSVANSLMLVRNHMHTGKKVMKLSLSVLFFHLYAYCIHLWHYAYERDGNELIIFINMRQRYFDFKWSLQSISTNTKKKNETQYRC